ncbi:MAG: CDP-alcohol phosphatidyltransferase family protein [Planctomycetia bacterium]|nr:CDP-alcohol phosphatidyltransferase family protein [Planctomycetia bacterium]
MSIETKLPLRPSVWTLPNQLTVSRIALSIVLFVCIAYRAYPAAFVLFVVAASTDWLDGFLARKYGLVTQLGRILDPFADKMIICGTFIFLAAVPTVAVAAGGALPDAIVSGSGIRPWMAVLVMGRELLVTALRSFIEQRGTDFSADMSGKLKMVLQCIAAGSSLFYLAYRPSWLLVPLDIAVWSAVALTVYSGIAYIRRAASLIGDAPNAGSTADE